MPILLLTILRLIKLCQYEEAKKVRNMIDKILPKEEEDYYKSCDRKIEQMREKLHAKQEDNVAKQEESLKAIQWKDVRKRELEKNMYVQILISIYNILITYVYSMQQRIKNHAKDMTHAHLQETRIIPEMSVKPSALSQKRPVRV